MSLTEKLLVLFKENRDISPDNAMESGLTEKEYYQPVIVSKEFIGKRRWFNDYEIVYHIPAEDRYVSVTVGEPSSEMQEEWETYDPQEVFRTEETITVVKWVCRKSADN
jgi:hypothetical protein